LSESAPFIFELALLCEACQVRNVRKTPFEYAIDRELSEGELCVDIEVEVSIHSQTWVDELSRLWNHFANA
jgi:hypothetical protein